MLIAACSSNLIVILRRGSHNAATELRVIPLCDPFFLEVLLARGLTSWVPTCAPQPLVTCPGSVSTLLSRTTHLVHPWAWPSHGSYLSQGFPCGGAGTSRIRLLPTDTRTMALKPLFSSLCYCSELSRPEASLRCLNLVFCLGDTLTQRRLYLAMF